MSTEITCIVCPKSCMIRADAAGNIVETGDCPKGKQYAAEEIRDPRRVFTSTVWVDWGMVARVPVRTSKPIKKGDWKKAAQAIARLRAEAPIRFKQILVNDFLEEGIDLVATRPIEARPSGPCRPKRVSK